MPAEPNCRQCGTALSTSASTPGGPPREPRPLALRIIVGVLWLLVVDLVVRAAVGAIVGASTFCNASFQDCMEVGRSASLAFFAKYNGAVYFVSVGLTALLTYQGILPGTAATRKAR